MGKQLLEYLEAVRRLNVNRSRGLSPHKPCMLLAVLGLAESGGLRRNEIHYDPPLLERYANYFEVVRGPSDHLNPYFPFFHLRGDGFWHLRPLPGREEILAALDSARSVSAVTENVAYAYLDDELYTLVRDAKTRAELREELAVAWFGSFRAALEPVLQEERAIDKYETSLRDGASVGLAIAEPAEPVRSAAFRRIVSEIYDFRCAASGWRIILPDSRVMVEAAHLIPFSETHDDDPRNGIALAPSFHWALDANIIAPGPDYKWHVSKVLDDRFADNHPMLDLAGRSLVLPREKSFWPKAESLQWRVDHLLGVTATEA